MKNTTVIINRNDLLYLREEEGLTNQEIAKRLDISVGTVYKHIGAQGWRKKSVPKLADDASAVAKAMHEAILAKTNKEPKPSMATCNLCANRGPGCNFCKRNPFLKDYFARKGR